MPQYAQNLAFNGLGTLSVTVPSAGDYFCEGHITIPTITNGGGQSSLLVVVNQNGSPVYTGQAGAEGFRTVVSCAANDVIAIVFSSSNPNDLVLNAIKSVISIGQGV